MAARDPRAAFVRAWGSLIAAQRELEHALTRLERRHEASPEDWETIGLALNLAEQVTEAARKAR